jgi:hypothetical protein
MLSVVFAIVLSDWIPARWFSAEVRSIGLLAESPINCLLMEAPLIDRDFTGSAAARGSAFWPCCIEAMAWRMQSGRWRTALPAS